MYIALIIFHVIACLVLIAVVLLQAGRGGGMSDMLGGGQPQSFLGTQTNDFMMRATEICAVIFVITSLSLGIISTQRGKSLVERNRLQRAMKAALPGMPGAPAAKSAAAPASPAAAPTTAAAVENTQAAAPEKMPSGAAVVQTGLEPDVDRSPTEPAPAPAAASSTASSEPAKADAR